MVGKRQTTKHTRGELVSASTLDVYSHAELQQHCGTNNGQVLVADPWAVEWQFIDRLSALEGEVSDNSYWSRVMIAGKFRTWAAKPASDYTEEELPECSHTLFQTANAMDLKLIEDLNYDGSTASLSSRAIAIHKPGDLMSAFCTHPERIDKGVQEQWMNWRSFRLFQIRQRCNLSAVEEGLEFWERSVDELLRDLFQYDKTIELHHNPYEQDRRTTWIEYLAFNCLSQQGQLPEEADPFCEDGETFPINLHKQWRPDGLSSAARLQHTKAAQPFRSISQVLNAQSGRVFEYDCSGLVGGIDWEVRQDCINLKNKIDSILDKVQNNEVHLYYSHAQGTIIWWIYEELRTIDRSSENDRDSPPTKGPRDGYPKLQASLFTPERLARTQRICDQAATLGWTDETICTVPQFEDLGGLRLFRDCFYGGILGSIDELYPPDDPCNGQTRAIFEKFTTAEEPLSPISKLMRYQQDETKKKGKPTQDKEMEQLERLRTAGYNTLREELLELCESQHGVEAYIQYLRKNRGDPEGKLPQLREKKMKEVDAKKKLQSRKRGRSVKVKAPDKDITVSADEEPKQKRNRKH